MAYKILCVGPPRSGTTTLHEAFTAAGIKSIHGNFQGDYPPVAVLLWRAFLEDRNPLCYVPDWVEAITDPHLTRNEGWDKVTLWPAFCPGFLRSYRHHNPEAWIILNTRKPLDWVGSVDRWKDLRSRIVKSDLPFLPPHRGSDDGELVHWLGGHFERVRSVFKGDPRFVEVAIEDENTPKRLGEALGIELPWWGVANANPEKQ